MTELWFILVVVGVLAGLVMLWGVTREKGRDAAMALVGEQLGLRYERDGSVLTSQPFTRFSLFQEGRRQRFKNVLMGKVDLDTDFDDENDRHPTKSSGEMGRKNHGDDNAADGQSRTSIEVMLFDYRYITGTHRHHHVNQATVAAFHAVGETLPEFSLQPENLLHKIGGLLGYQDIDFEENPGFSGRYLLRGPQEDAIRRLFTSEVLDFFDQRPGWCVEAGGDWIVVFRRGRRVGPQDLGEFLKQAFEVCTMVAIHF